MVQPNNSSLYLRLSGSEMRRSAMSTRLHQRHKFTCKSSSKLNMIQRNLHGFTLPVVCTQYQFHWHVCIVSTGVAGSLHLAHQLTGRAHADQEPCWDCWDIPSGLDPREDLDMGEEKDIWDILICLLPPWYGHVLDTYIHKWEKFDG